MGEIGGSLELADGSLAPGSVGPPLSQRNTAEHDKAKYLTSFLGTCIGRHTHTKCSRITLMLECSSVLDSFLIVGNLGKKTFQIVTQSKDSVNGGHWNYFIIAILVTR